MTKTDEVEHSSLSLVIFLFFSLFIWGVENLNFLQPDKFILKAYDILTYISSYINSCSLCLTKKCYNIFVLKENDTLLNQAYNYMFV